LLEEHDLARLRAAVERALQLGVRDAAAVRLLLVQQAEQPAATFDLRGRPTLQAVHVPAVNLTQYGNLLHKEHEHA
jgi:hypothetical protein